MKTTKIVVVAAALLSGFISVRAQVQEEAIVRFDAARLDQLVAPIALYPDTLLMQVLMASTYPLEVVEADRFVRENNPSQSPEALQAALSARTWDPSVKALAGFPDVLKLMSDNLDWTRDLGDAFLAQRTELMDAVQRMREKARAAGTLTTTPQQVVTTRDDRIIVVEPANPSVIYVPTYSPYSVYGGWSYPYYYYPRAYNYWPLSSGLVFSIGFAFGDWLWGYPTWGWGASNFYVDAYRYNRFNSWTGYNWSESNAVAGTRFDWTHQPEHRAGVRYRDPAVARQFGATRDWRPSREEARGFPRTSTPERVDGVERTAPRSQPPVVTSPERAPAQRTPEPRPAPRTVSPREEQQRSVNPRPEPRSVTPRQEQRTVNPRPEPRTATPRPEPRSVSPRPEAAPQPQPRVQRDVRPEPQQRVAPRGQSTWSGSRNPSFDRRAVERGSRSRGQDVDRNANRGGDDRNSGRPRNPKDG